MSVVIPDRFACRRRTAASWTSLNEVLLKGEIGLESDTGKFKFGNGVDGWNLRPYAATDIAEAIHAATGKTTPVDADEFALVDSAASNVLKKLTWANVKARLKAYFDTIYQIGGTSGLILQVVRTESTAVGTVTSTTLPVDNTIPQNTEGAAYTALDTTITPLSAASTIEVEIHFPIVAANGGTVALRIAVFRDSGANAVYAAFVNPATSGLPVTLRFSVPANATTATTFTLRVGVNSGTGYLNGSNSGVRLFGTAQRALMRVTEVG